MCQGAVRRLCNLSARCHVRKVACLLAQPLILQMTLVRNDPVNTACCPLIEESRGAKMIKPRCKVPKSEAAEPASARWHCRTKSLYCSCQMAHLRTTSKNS